VVERIRLECGHAVLLRELVAGVGHIRLHGAAVERALANHLEVFASLAHVHRDGHHLCAGRVCDPADGDGGVKAA